MQELTGKKVLVIGLGASGMAASRLLVSRGARVTAADSAVTAALESDAELLRGLGVTVVLGAKSVQGEFDLVVISPGVPPGAPLIRSIRAGVPVIGELELGYQQALCLNISITGTNGKTTTTEMVASVLEGAGRKTIAAGNIGLPLSAVVEQSKELDLLTLEVSSFQLETIRFFRPAVAVLLNLTPDHLDRYATMEDYIRAKAALFRNQQPFDWAIIQSEALAQLRSLNLLVSSKVITFSAENRRADIYLDRGLLISRLPGWTGPLVDLETCQVKGPHNAENLMAALAVGRVLRLPLENMVQTLRKYRPAAHRCEPVALLNGVQYINDSKATNVDAVAKAIQSVPLGERSDPNIILIAGGKDKGLHYHDIGPLLARRVKHAYLLGETREKIRAAWSLFTPCTLVDSLLEAVSKASKNAVSGDVVLLSPACSSFDMFQHYQHRGEVFRQAVSALGEASHGGSAAGATISGGSSVGPEALGGPAVDSKFSDFAVSFIDAKTSGEPNQSHNLNQRQML